MPSELVEEVARSGSVDVLVSYETSALAQLAPRRSGGSPSERSAQDTKTSQKLATAFTKHKSLTREIGSVELVQDWPTLPVQMLKVSSEAALRAIADQPGVVSIAPNRRGGTELKESLPLIGQPEVARLGLRGGGVTVAVLDTGVDYTKSAFGSCKTAGGSCPVVAANDIAPNDKKLDADGHGTNVAAIVLGVAPDTKIAALDVFDKTNQWSDAYLNTALQWVADNQSKYNIRAVNMSLGQTGTYYSASCDASSGVNSTLATVTALGVVPVVASGNSAFLNGSYKSGVAYPACDSNALAVGAVYDSSVGKFTVPGKLHGCTDGTTAADKITCFSQGGSKVAVLAPGAKITAAGATMSGTSQAAPHVAGAVAVLASGYPNATVGQLSYSLQQSHTLLVDPRESSADGFRFLPRLDVPAAAQAMASLSHGRLLIYQTEFGETGAPQIQSWLEAAGYQVDIATILPADLGSYSQVWWYGIGSLSDADVQALVSYAKSGGGLYLTGEWQSCFCNNDTVTTIFNSLVVTVGGLQFGPDMSSGFDQPIVNRQALGDADSSPNVLETYLTNAVGTISSANIAGDHFLFTDGSGFGTVGLWDNSNVVGGGRLVINMDVNWAMDSYGDPVRSKPMAQNIAAFLSGPRG